MRRELETRTKESPVELELNNWNYYRPQQPANNPLQFGIEMAKDRANNPLPLLTKLPLDIYSIPAMSLEYESVFSETKRVITNGRTRLSATNIEAFQYRRSRLTQKAV